MPQSTRPARVFVVDDMPVIASTLAAILERFGFDATPFTEPLKALQAAQSTPLDLQISDVDMPRLSGVELAIQVKKRHPKCAVLLLSGQVAAIERVEAARAAGQGFELLTKPVHPECLLAKIRAVAN